MRRTDLKGGALVRSFGIGKRVVGHCCEVRVSALLLHNAVRMRLGTVTPHQLAFLSDALSHPRKAGQAYLLDHWFPKHTHCNRTITDQQSQTNILFVSSTPLQSRNITLSYTSTDLLCLVSPLFSAPSRCKHWRISKRHTERQRNVTRVLLLARSRVGAPSPTAFTTPHRHTDPSQKLRFGGYACLHAAATSLTSDGTIAGVPSHDLRVRASTAVWLR